MYSALLLLITISSMVLLSNGRSAMRLLLHNRYTTTSLMSTSGSDIIPRHPNSISIQPGTSPVELQPIITPINNHSTVMVVGSSRGLGKEFVTQLMSKGAQVIATYRGPHIPDNLMSLYHEELKRSGPRQFHLLEMDVSSEVSISTAKNTFKVDNFPPLTHIIYAAGVYGPRIQLGEVAQEAMMDVYRINTVGPMLVAQAFAPLLASEQHQENGSGPPIIAFLTSKVGSVDENTGGGGYLYRASKAALNVVAKSLSIDLAGEVAVLLLHPGYVRTDMTGGKGLIETDESVAGMLRAIEATGKGTPFRWVDYKACLIPW